MFRIVLHQFNICDCLGPTSAAGDIRVEILDDCDVRIGDEVSRTVAWAGNRKIRDTLLPIELDIGEALELEMPGGATRRITPG